MDILESLDLISELTAKHKRILSELKGITEKPKEEFTPGLKIRAGNLTVAAARLEEQIAEARKSGDAIEPAAIESGDGTRPDGHKGGASTKGALTVNEGARQWAHAAASQLVKAARDHGVKAVAAGSFDAPGMMRVGMVPMPVNPARLLDLLVDRQPIAGNEFEFLRQTVRTDAAAAVVDGDTKPTSTYTVTSIQDRARIYAHLSQAIPERVLQDHADIADFLNFEMSRGVLDALEADVVSGAAAQENVVGIVNTSGVGTTAFAVSIPNTLRKAYTASQVAKEAPTAWALNPADAENLDLLQTADGEYVIDGGAFQNIFKNLPVVVSTSVPSGKALLADWRMARLFVRQDLVLDFDRSGTLFTKNQVIARAEGRFGFALLRPSAFRVISTA
ncbi:phage major capsid protein [Streptomyces sp. MZ04]|uniref:phage major capsid protein n=1 Tax=Streptomyces sp. MZ04 TaxID=2559236 RepID=UPI00107EC4D3|nr:phage major capsid protein [Streptomyces sp. MZ04]TGA88442.1 phage major capsid protein [Streptomyces sp. MZ04]